MDTAAHHRAGHDRPVRPDARSTDALVDDLAADLCIYERTVAYTSPIAAPLNRIDSLCRRYAFR